jgi:hypothetical protein
MKIRKYHPVRTVPKYHTVRTVPKYHTVRTVPKYHPVRTVPKYHTVRTVLKYHTVRTVTKYHTVRTVPKYHTVGTFPKSNRQIVEAGKIVTSNAYIHDNSLLRTGMSIKSGKTILFHPFGLIWYYLTFQSFNYKHTLSRP